MGFAACELQQSDKQIAALSLRHLEEVVRVDSHSDESSTTIPSTPGQEALAELVARFFSGQGARVSRDEHANVVARLDGRGSGVTAPPLALMVHLDTSRGTRAVDELNVLEAWQGQPIPYPENAALRVAGDTYPAVAAFLGQDVVYGPGRAPFGLDDKLGLTHLMTLAVLLKTNPQISHPPLFLIGRPDEEIGRMQAVEGLAEFLAQVGVRHGYTVDGILPFEINVENFNASVVRVRFSDREVQSASGARAHTLRVSLGGVNTHGATARTESHRNATRLAVEATARLSADGLVPLPFIPLHFATDPHRECDAEWALLLDTTDATEMHAAVRALERVLDQVVGPHAVRGASWRIGSPAPLETATRVHGTTAYMLKFLETFLSSNPGLVLLAEDSDGSHGYTHPYRAMPVDGGVQIEFRVRDFEAEGREAREAHVCELASQHGASSVEATQQYVNMGPRVQQHPELVEWAMRAGRASGAQTCVQPIRGGTGVDPFLDRGVAVANLGTGYFAPESEKEFTSLQMMVRHARWLATLVQGLARN